MPTAGVPFNGLMYDSALLTTETENEPLLLSVRSAAELLAVKEVTMRKWIANKIIHSVKLNNARRVPLTEVKRLAWEGTGVAASN